MKRITALVLAALVILAIGLAAAETADTSKAKYVFFFIGDGMSSPQTTAAQYYLGTRGNPDADTPMAAPLTFTQFPVSGQINTFDATSFAPDSASTATSMSTGHKTLSGSINVGFTQGEKGLVPDAEQPFKIITEYAKEASMKVGVITSVSLDHATPAAFYAKAPKRNAYYDIAVQGLTGGVVDFLGGGSYLQPTGPDKDQKDVLDVARENGFAVYNTREEIRAVDGNAGNVLAISPDLQDSSALPYEIDRLASNDGSLSLAEFTAAGIRAMEGNEKGFFMMVEGGKIDWAGHANDVGAVIYDIYALSDAVQVAVDFARSHPEDTLIVVTGDHETGGMTIGYAETGYDVHMDYLQNQKLSYVAFDRMLSDMAASQASFDDVMAAVAENYGLTREEGSALSLNARDISRLSAAYTFGMLPSSQRAGVTGPEEKLHYGGYNPVSVTASHILANKAGIDFSSYSHTGVSLPVYAVGAGAELFNGHYDNTQIFDRFMDAMGLAK